MTDAKRCDRCGKRYVYLGLAPICLKCDKPGDYIRRGRTLRDGTKISPAVQQFEQLYSKHEDDKS